MSTDSLDTRAGQPPSAIGEKEGISGAEFAPILAAIINMSDQSFGNEQEAPGVELERQIRVELLYDKALKILELTNGSGDKVVDGPHEAPCEYIVSVQPNSPEDSNMVDSKIIHVTRIKVGTQELDAYDLRPRSIRKHGKTERLTGEALHEALEGLEYPIEQIVELHDKNVTGGEEPLPGEQKARLSWNGVKRGARILAKMGAVAALVAVPAHRHVDESDRQNLTAADLGLPAGTEVLLGKDSYPKSTDIDPDAYNLFSLTGDRSLDWINNIMQPTYDEELTLDDGIRIVEVPTTGGCEVEPIEDNFDIRRDKITSWTTYRTIGGRSLSKWVTVKLKGPKDGGYSLQVCSEPAPGILTTTSHANSPATSVEEDISVLIQFEPKE